MHQHRIEARNARLLRERVELAVQMVASQLALAETRALLARLAATSAGNPWHTLRQPGL
jgi:hypothetical protein